MQKGLAARFGDAIHAQGLLGPGDRVGAAVSGGADSIAMLRLLYELRNRLGIVPVVLHFNHKLRGNTSDADEQFVRKLASRLQLEFHCQTADIARIAKRAKRNLEDAGRRARYAWFEGIAKEQRLAWIATAHTADDQAETVLAHLLRGTGIAGLAGIHRVAGNVMRPLLDFRRASLRAYLRKIRQPWREDPTNRDTKRTRARIRHQLIPLLEKRFQPLVVEHLAALAMRAHENDALLRTLASHVRNSLVAAEPGGLRIRARDLLAAYAVERPNELRAISARVVLDLAAEIKPGTGQLTSVHVDAVLRLAQRGEPGKLLQLPGGVRVRREGDSLLFFAAGQLRE